MVINPKDQAKNQIAAILVNGGANSMDILRSLLCEAEILYKSVMDEVEDRILDGSGSPDENGIVRAWAIEQFGAEMHMD